MSKVAVILSGCGVFDGAEIHESVICLLALSRHGAETSILAPNRQQMHVINHQTSEVDGSPSRNVMEEAARIARGPVFDIAEADPADFDALVMPGGFGAAKNLSSFAIDGADLSVDDGVAAFLRGMFEAGKPIGVACISPVVVAKVLGKSGIELTIGSDTDTAAAIEKLGARHVVKKVTEIHRDPKHPLVSTPAYMYEAPIREVAEGLEAMVAEVMKML